MTLNETQIVVIAEFVAKDGEEQQLIDNLFALVEPTHQEGGCIRYELNQDLDRPQVITFIEKWHSRETLDQHIAKPYIQNFFNGAGPRKPKHTESFTVTFHREFLH
ncbi:putative quinol monooxygenase [Candidatus Haliotispira prima]|uniref:Quinol monooxygenase n=1 Tax=Candidatus Haliotispira prima TaxID=3034016 RepID=A0ABY8MHL9_9SPIO|nr:putative quinol monooxygenase [Candidatus Haliotispira prima]